MGSQAHLPRDPAPLIFQYTPGPSFDPGNSFDLKDRTGQWLADRVASSTTSVEFGSGFQLTRGHLWPAYGEPSTVQRKRYNDWYDRAQQLHFRLDGGTAELPVINLEHGNATTAWGKQWAVYVNLSLKRIAPRSSGQPAGLFSTWRGRLAAFPAGTYRSITVTTRREPPSTM